MSEGGVAYTCPVLRFLWARVYGPCWWQNGVVSSICLSRGAVLTFLRKQCLSFLFIYFSSYTLNAEMVF